MRIVGLLSLLTLFLPADADAVEWPQFRGPSGQGHAEARNLPVRWSENENITWKAAIPGTGWSSPVVDGRQIWMTTALDDGLSLRAVCVDRDSGEILHNVEVFRIEEPVYGGANGWCPPDSTVYSEPLAEKAWGRLLAMYGKALA